MNTTLRTLRTTTGLLLAVAFGLIAFVNASTYGAPEAGWVGMDQFDRSAAPVNVPTWDADTAAQFPGCVSNETGAVAYTLVVVQGDGTATLMAYADVERAGQTANRADDVWVVGVCPGR